MTFFRFLRCVKLFYRALRRIQAAPSGVIGKVPWLARMGLCGWNLFIFSQGFHLAQLPIYDFYKLSVVPFSTNLTDGRMFLKRQRSAGVCLLKVKLKVDRRIRSVNELSLGRKSCPKSGNGIRSLLKIKVDLGELALNRGLFANISIFQWQKMLFWKSAITGQWGVLLRKMHHLSLSPSSVRRT